jgi:hypothetical protein
MNKPEIEPPLWKQRFLEQCILSDRFQMAEWVEREIVEKRPFNFVPFGFVVWYSGMNDKKILAAYERYLKEVKADNEDAE